MDKSLLSTSLSVTTGVGFFLGDEVLGVGVIGGITGTSASGGYQFTGSVELAAFGAGSADVSVTFDSIPLSSIPIPDSIPLYAGSSDPFPGMYTSIPVGISWDNVAIGVGGVIGDGPSGVAQFLGFGYNPGTGEISLQGNVEGTLLATASPTVSVTSTLDLTNINRNHPFYNPSIRSLIASTAARRHYRGFSWL